MKLNLDFTSRVKGIFIMLKQALGMLMFAALIAASAPLLAQPKVGYMDLEHILRESKRGQEAQRRIDAEFSKRDQELLKMAEELNKQQADLEKNFVTMATLERQQRERALNSASAELQRRRREFADDLNQRRSEELAEVAARVNEVVKKIVEAENYDLVFREAVWISPAIDITDKVLKALDEAGAAAPAAK
jgi:outer membrane protein